MALLKDPAAIPGLVLSRQRRPVREKEQKRSRVEAEAWEGVDRELFGELRGVRLQIARARRSTLRHLHDTTLRELGARQAAIDGRAPHDLRRRSAQAEDLGEQRCPTHMIL